MDNIPRLESKYDQELSNGKMIWNDICFQSIINCNILIKMNKELGNIDNISDLIEEEARLRRLVNDKLWDDKTNYYYDLWNNNIQNNVKHIGAYWALLAKTLDKDKIDNFVAHLENENEFNRPMPIPTLSFDHPSYSQNGSYWKGGVWAPTNYMVLNGLKENNYFNLAYKIADKYLKEVVKTFNKDKTLWENYSPEGLGKGEPAKADFVGWTGLAPISIFFEYVLGIQADVPNNCIIWHVNKLERHGILKYPFGVDSTIDLICEERKSEEEVPKITIKSTKKIKVKVYYNDDKKILSINN